MHATAPLTPATCTACLITSLPHSAGSTTSDRYYADAPVISSTAPERSRHNFGRPLNSGHRANLLSGWPLAGALHAHKAPLTADNRCGTHRVAAAGARIRALTVEIAAQFLAPRTKGALQAYQRRGTTVRRAFL